MGLLDQVLGNASKIDAAEVQSEFASGSHTDLALNAETQRTRRNAEKGNTGMLGGQAGVGRSAAPATTINAHPYFLLFSALLRVLCVSALRGKFQKSQKQGGIR